MEKSRKAATVTDVTIKRTVNGGFIVRHSFDNASCGPSYKSPDEFAFKNQVDMLAHVTKTLGQKE